VVVVLELRIRKTLRREMEEVTRCLRVDQMSGRALVEVLARMAMARMEQILVALEEVAQMVEMERQIR